MGVVSGKVTGLLAALCLVISALIQVLIATGKLPSSGYVKGYSDDRYHSMDVQLIKELWEYR
jgi:hypothetical protein